MPHHVLSHRGHDREESRDEEVKCREILRLKPQNDEKEEELLCRCASRNDAVRKVLGDSSYTRFFG